MYNAPPGTRIITFFGQHFRGDFQPHTAHLQSRASLTNIQREQPDRFTEHMEVPLSLLPAGVSVERLLPWPCAVDARPPAGVAGIVHVETQGHGYGIPQLPLVLGERLGARAIEVIWRVKGRKLITE